MTNLLTLSGGSVLWQPGVFVAAVLGLIVAAVCGGVSLVVIWHAFKVCVVWWLHERNDTEFYQPPLIEQQAMKHAEQWRDDQPLSPISGEAKVDALSNLLP